jgi:PAS domain S-box-containing protein
MGRRADAARAAAGYITAIALVVVVTALGGRWMNFWHERGPMLAFALVIVIAGMTGGAGAAVFCTLLSTAALIWFFLEPLGSLQVSHPSDLAHVAFLLVIGGAVAVSAAAGERRAARRNAISEERRRRAEEAEHALRASEGRLRRLMESNVLGVLHSSADGTIYDANDFVLRMLGYSHEEVAAGRLRWPDVTPAEYLPLDERGIAEALARGACTPYEKEYVAKDGRRVPVLLGYALLEGPRTDFICFALDLTEQKRAEAALAEQITRAITDHASAAFFMIDARGFCTFMNPAAEAMIGWSLPELARVKFHDAVHHHHPDGRPYPSGECVVKRVLSSGGAVAREDVYFRRSGEPFPVALSAGCVRRPGREPCLLLEVRDITAQARAAEEREALLASERAARAQAERASRAKDEFVATLSHELRTPLNAIVGFTHLARRPGQGPVQAARALEVIERNASLLTQIISDLLDVSRIVTGKLSLEIAPVELGPVIEAALTSIAGPAEAKGVTLHADLREPSTVVRGDAFRLQQVVWNLVSNAIKFTPPGGRVDVSLSARDTRAEVVVSDTGQGMDPAFVPCLFERFRQADASSTRRHGGLGLGLSIVKHLVELHGGEVRAASDGPGRGARFTVVLPRSAAPLSAGAAPARAADAPLAGARVLVVEDEPDAQELVKRLLEEQGARVVTASSAGEALAAVEERPPDVMISDIGMPGMDGYELIRRVRANAAAHDVPAVALTAYARPEDRTRALESGYQAHLAKPVVPAELLATVARLAHVAAHAP